MSADDFLPDEEGCREMRADHAYRDFAVVETVERDDHWEVRLNKPVQDWISIRRDQIARPRVGTLLRLFGDGDGQPIRGVAVEWMNGWRGVYYRREAIRCACGDRGWNHPGGGPCKRSVRPDGTRGACACQGYRPMPARDESGSSPPLPWRWDNSDDPALRDAAGNVIACVSQGQQWIASPRVRALTEAAPELAAMLQEVRTYLSILCGDIDDSKGAALAFKAHLLLDRIDKASKGGT